MTLDEQIKILQAIKDGKTVQYKLTSGWTTMAEDEVRDAKSGFRWLDFQHYTYRIKPEPIERWINVYKGYVSTDYNTLEQANQGADKDRIRLAHLVEVCE